MRILVAVDCSSFANEVIDEIAARRWSDDSEIRLVSVVEPTGSWDMDQGLLHQARTILGERLHLLKLKLPEHLNIESDLLEGKSAPMILEEAKVWRADLIILGSHGDTGVRREQIGSVAAAIVNQAPCSVEVVKLHRKSLQLS